MLGFKEKLLLCPKWVHKAFLGPKLTFMNFLHISPLDFSEIVADKMLNVKGDKIIKVTIIGNFKENSHCTQNGVNGACLDPKSPF